MIQKDIVKNLITMFTVILIFLTAFPIIALSHDTESQSSLNTVESEGLMQSETENSSSGELLPEENTSNASSNEDLVDEFDETKEMPEKNASAFRAAEDFTEIIEVTDWDIKDDGNTLSETYAAEPGKNYDFNFSWKLSLWEGKTIQGGDFFKIYIPHNIGNDKEEPWGGWGLLSSNWLTFSMMIDGVDTSIGQWRVTKDESGNDFIEAQFVSDVDGLNISEVVGTDFAVASKSLNNHTIKGGVQKVRFGNVDKLIAFEPQDLNENGGWDFKYPVSASDSEINYRIGVNFSSLNELSGDKFDPEYTSPDYERGFGYNPYNQPYDWGENFTNVPGAYVEDPLDEGVTVSSINIAGFVKIPLGLQANADRPFSGGIPSNNISFQSNVLADYGNGPVYRQEGNDSDLQKPTKEVSFKRLTQNTSESLEDFRERVKSQPYQYGIYVEGSGKNAKRTVMINFGNITAENGQQRKLSELTNSRYADPPRTVDGKPSVLVNEFAAQGADFSIKNDFYKEEDRKLLEDYYTLAFGDTNTIGGQITSYQIDLLVRYSPENAAGEKTNIAKFGMNTVVYPPETSLPRDIPSESIKLTPPHATIKLQNASVVLFKINEDTNQFLNGAKFKLQKKVDGQWQTYKDNLITGDFREVGTDGQTHTFSGGTRVNDLSEGTYRFVETEAPKGYLPKESSDWDDEVQAVVSKEFTISSQGVGSMLFVRNKPNEKASYKVEHWIQKEDSSDEYELKESEQLFDFIGEKVGADYKVYTQYTANPKHKDTLTSGVVKSDNSLVLKLFYDIDLDAIPFTIYKNDGTWEYWGEGNRGETLASNAQHTVAFDVYKFRWVQGNDPTKEIPSQSVYWEKVRENLKTDEKGRIKDATLDLQEGGDQTFALVEVENTYPHYQVPEAAEVYWVVWTKGGQISWVDTIGDQSMQAGFDTERGAYYIPNNFAPGEFKLYKGNEKNEPMPSDNEKQVKFNAYEYIGDWGEGKRPHEIDPGSENGPSIWKLLNTEEPLVTDKNGMILDKELESKTYALEEIQTYPDYELETDSYWIIWTAKSSDKGIHISGMEYIGENDPGQLTPQETPNGYYYIKNRQKKKDFIFTKEDQQKGVLPDVEFALYKGKAGESLTEDNANPNVANSYWELESVYQRAVSSESGQVEFKNLTAGNYLLVETKTTPGFQLPKGQWILTIDTINDSVEIKGRDDPPAFRIEDGNYYLPNHLQTVLPTAGGLGKIILVVSGIVMLGAATMISMNKSEEKSKKIKEMENAK